MRFSLALALVAAAGFVSPAHAQFGSGIVFDPTQSAHAIQQIAQADQLYTTTVSTTRNVIAAYNLAQHMATLPQTLYTSYTNLGRQQWTTLTTPANTYGNSLLWMNSASTGYSAASANQTASIPRITQLTGYGSLSSNGQQAIAARGATVDLSDAVDASSLQTIGTIRANSTQLEADIARLEADSHSTDPSQQTEMATLQRINQALLIELRTEQETNQLLQAQALQQLIRSEAATGQPEGALRGWQQLPAELQHSHPTADQFRYAVGLSLLTGRSGGNGLSHSHQERL